ncbi:MAG: hypothetical protein U1E76_11115 [Planctomycetota bacterium]
MGHELPVDVAAYLEQGDAALSTEAKLHLAQCVRCQRLLDAQQRVRQQLRAVKPLAAPDALTLESVLARLPIGVPEEASSPALERMLASVSVKRAPPALKAPRWSLLRESSPRPRSSRALRLRLAARWVLIAASVLVVVGLALQFLGPRARQPTRASLVHASVLAIDPYQDDLSASTRERLLPFGPWLAMAVPPEGNRPESQGLEEAPDRRPPPGKRGKPPEGRHQ